MTAPTPEQMRALARELEGGHWAGAADTRAAAALRAAADEIDRLREMIEETPHMPACSSLSPRVGFACDCWKADAL